MIYFVIILYIREKYKWQGDVNTESEQKLQRSKGANVHAVDVQGNAIKSPNQNIFLKIFF